MLRGVFQVIILRNVKHPLITAPRPHPTDPIFVNFK